MGKMELKICLDTEFLVEFLKGRKETFDFIKKNSGTSEFNISIITLFELYYGAFKNKNTKQLALIEELLTRFTVLNLSQDIVKEAGKDYARLEKEGNIIDFRDILIGISAKTNNCAVKTKNIKHFKRIEGLKLL